MSKKSKRKRKKRQLPPRRFPWTWLAAGGALLLALVLLLWQPWSGDDVEPLADYPQSGSPHLVVEQRTVDEGYVQYSVPVSSAFVLRNEGDQPLKILEQPQVELVRGCWPPQAVVSSTTIEPGGQATLKMDYTMPEGMGGPHEFHVRLRTNDPVEPEMTLVALSDWGP